VHLKEPAVCHAANYSFKTCTALQQASEMALHWAAKAISSSELLSIPNHLPGPQTANMTSSLGMNHCRKRHTQCSARH
jgi:hypothetical protein